MRPHIHMQQTGVVMLENRQEQEVFVRQSRHRKIRPVTVSIWMHHMTKPGKRRFLSCLVFQPLLLQNSVSQSAAFSRQQEI